ncbi:mechanosensitive ion channel [Prochlorothrix hollandica]|uniref:Conserved TM helix repeat-containing protein n=1 Tax=Prochlorothrix hollandica PCC 9006 = CALU 1027 TaxID=317619 RepID=A0A0M2PXE9_PROHO|nr:mechanosensitive ion channel [Prochlorothrix hollandica]KKI99061.1 conserved TM helix repeat-containing protein [Prochlorothrix hollandica PCC 9006 = CALU 1027]
MLTFSDLPLPTPGTSGFGFDTPKALLAQSGGLDPSTLLEQIGLDQITGRVLSLLSAVAILILGWIIALILSSVVQGLLSRTDLDNKLAAWVLGKDGGELPKVERGAGLFTFWVVMIFAIVAFLNALELDAVSAPLQSFLDEIATYAPRILSASIWMGVAWLLATVVRTLLTRGMERFKLDDQLAQQLGGEEGSAPALPLNETLGNVLYWFILLFFLPFILDALQLQGPLAPIQNLIDELLSALPQVFKALLIGGIGWLLARLIQNVVSSFLRAMGADSLGSRFGLSGDSLSLSTLAGNLIYALVILFTAISALEALAIDAVSEPAVAMLNQILAAIPYVLQATLILFLFYLGSKFVSELATNILTSLGFNDVLNWLGLQTLLPSETTPDGDNASSLKTPSEVVGIITGVGIMLVGVIEAVDSLELEQLSAIIATLTAGSGQILAGLVVFAIALFLGNLAYRLVSLQGDRQSKLLGSAARISILVFGAAMGLRQMGIATNIVDLAFGLLFGAIAVAIAIAFGWGGKEVAATQLKKWVDSLNEREIG